MKELFSNYQKCNLDDARKVWFSRRVDLKYVIDCEKLNDVFNALEDEYYVVEHNNICALPYHTLYYDNERNSSYLNHHNKHLPRYKIRKRSYEASGDVFLELKTKTNKNNTVKQRMPLEKFEAGLSEMEFGFLKENIHQAAGKLSPVIEIWFDRITLVRKDYKERCTIDTNYRVKNDLGEKRLEDIAIVEVKHEMFDHNSFMKKVLKGIGAYPQGFSKYCMGRALLDKNLKRNNFKMKLRLYNHK
jgi:hypothetical protein